jgi:hypothetical protein
MAVMAPHDVSIDRLAHAHLIRDTFAGSPLFRDAAISEPAVTPAGGVALTVSFDGDPAVFRVVAGSEVRAYAVLLELAQAMVGIAQRHGARR